ncbi:MAG TPA: hypothetical protein VEM41_02590 [Actinomycetota bacterium]|nr:hypothetical protein [Actinomycetota bacterium]
MAWVVIASEGRGRDAVFESEQDAEAEALRLAAEVDEDTWVAIADQESSTTRVIKVGADD